MRVQLLIETEVADSRLDDVAQWVAEQRESVISIDQAPSPLPLVVRARITGARQVFE